MENNLSQQDKVLSQLQKDLQEEFLNKRGVGKLDKEACLVGDLSGSIRGLF